MHVAMFDLDSMKLWSARIFHRAICCAFRLQPSKESFGFFVDFLTLLAMYFVGP